MSIRQVCLIIYYLIYFLQILLAIRTQQLTSNLIIFIISLTSMNKTAVFVYGDLGRSPRMQNHTQMLSQTHQVYFFGYFQTSPRISITRNERIQLVDLEIKKLQIFRKLSFYIYALIRIIVQILQILYLFGYKHKNFQFVLIQNPPSIPNLFALWLASFFGKYKIYIDFHNYGYTILNMRIKNKYLIKIATIYEKFFGRKAAMSFCVSDKMKQDLSVNWGIEAITLYDRPLKRNTVKLNKATFFKKYQLDAPQQDELLIVSSTSWTKDEDFSILLDALQSFEQSNCKKKIRALITGKGPQKQKYLKEIEKLKPSWKKISVTAVWLDADDYPVLLSLCDLGVCLHYSSSGLDLPMKVVDMFGAGIPVLAIHYQALSQLLKQGENGYIFHSKVELFQRLVNICQKPQTLNTIKKGAQKQKNYTWDVEWRKKFKLQVKKQKQN